MKSQLSKRPASRRSERRAPLRLVLPMLVACLLTSLQPVLLSRSGCAAAAEPIPDSPAIVASCCAPMPADSAGCGCGCSCAALPGEDGAGGKVCNCGEAPEPPPPISTRGQDASQRALLVAQTRAASISADSPAPPHAAAPIGLDPRAAQAQDPPPTRGGPREPLCGSTTRFLSRGSLARFLALLSFALR